VCERKERILARCVGLSHYASEGFVLFLVLESLLASLSSSETVLLGWHVFLKKGWQREQKMRKSLLRSQTSFSSCLFLTTLQLPQSHFHYPLLENCESESWCGCEVWAMTLRPVPFVEAAPPLPF